MTYRYDPILKYVCLFLILRHVVCDDGTRRTNSTFYDPTLTTAITNYGIDRYTPFGPLYKRNHPSVGKVKYAMGSDLGFVTLNHSCIVQNSFFRPIILTYNLRLSAIHTITH